MTFGVLLNQNETVSPSFQRWDFKMINIKCLYGMNCIKATLLQYDIWLILLLLQSSRICCRIFSIVIFFMNLFYISKPWSILKGIFARNIKCKVIISKILFHKLFRFHNVINDIKICFETSWQKTDKHVVTQAEVMSKIILDIMSTSVVVCLYHHYIIVSVFCWREYVNYKPTLRAQDEVADLDYNKHSHSSFLFILLCCINTIIMPLRELYNCTISFLR